MNESSSDGRLIALSVDGDNAGKHSGNEYDDDYQEEHEIVVKINDLLHDFRRGGLEVQLSRRSSVKQESNEATFCRLAAKRTAVFNAGGVNASRVTLGYRGLNSKHI